MISRGEMIIFILCPDYFRIILNVKKDIANV